MHFIENLDKFLESQYIPSFFSLLNQAIAELPYELFKQKIYIALDFLYHVFSANKELILWIKEKSPKMQELFHLPKMNDIFTIRIIQASKFFDMMQLFFQ